MSVAAGGLGFGVGEEIAGGMIAEIIPEAYDAGKTKI